MTDTITPPEAADKRIVLSEEYSRISSKVAILESHCDSFCVARREDYKSDKATERAWKATEEGIEYTWGKARLKAIEKELSSLKTLIEVATNMTRGYY